MLGRLLRHGGPSAKLYFEECAGDEFIDIWEGSTNQSVRLAVSNFEEEFLKASFNDGDLFF